MNEEDGDMLVKSPFEKPDPWKHRSAKMVCNTCMWFVLKEADTEQRIGRCRKHAPTLGGYPVVYDSDWCGDHKLDENRV